MTLGDILKKYREDNNISMDEFSQLSSLSKGYISMLENNINPRNNKPIAPTLPTIKKISNGMGIDVDTLLKMLDSDQEISLENDENAKTIAGIGRRIKEARNALNMTQEELAKSLGVTKGAVANYENGTSHLKEPIMCKLFSTLNVDANYLFHDVVNSPRKSNDVTLAEFEHIKKYRALDERGRHMIDLMLDAEYEHCKCNQSCDISKPSGRLIQFYQRLASAGTGQIVFDDVPVDLIEIPDIPEYSKAKYAIGVNGDSMEPLYKDSDILLVEPANNINEGDIGIFIVDGQSYVKKLGNKTLVSINDKYDDIPITEDTECLGRVIDKITDPQSNKISLDEMLALQVGRKILEEEKNNSELQTG